MVSGFTEVITVVRPGPRDRHGDPGEPTEHTIDDVIVAPSRSTENVDSGNQVTTRWDLYLPAGADIQATDRVRRAADPPPGETSDLKRRAPWVVVGDPSPWRSPWSGWNPGVVVHIERHTG